MTSLVGLGEVDASAAHNDGVASASTSSPPRLRSSSKKRSPAKDIIPASTDDASTGSHTRHSPPLTNPSPACETSAPPSAYKNERMSSPSPEPKNKRRRASKRRQASDMDGQQAPIADAQPSRRKDKRKSAHSLGIREELLFEAAELPEPSNSPPEVVFLSHPQHRQRKGSSSAPNVASSPLSMDPSSPASSPRSAASDGLLFSSAQLRRSKSNKSTTMPESTGTMESENSRGKLIQFFGESSVLFDANRIGWALQPAHVNALKLRKRFGESVPLDALSAYDTSDANVQSVLGSHGYSGSQSSSPTGGDEIMDLDEDFEGQARKKEAKQQKSALKIGRFFGDRSATASSSQKISRKSKSRFLSKSGSKDRIHKSELELVTKPHVSPSTQPPNVDPLKLNRFFGERVDIVKSTELTVRGPRTARSPSISSPATVVHSSAPQPEEGSPAGRTKSPKRQLKESGGSTVDPLASALSVLAALNELQLAAQISPYDGDSSSDVPSADSEEERKPKPSKSKKVSGRRLNPTAASSSASPIQTPSSTMFTASGTTLPTPASTITLSTPDLPRSHAWLTTELSPPSHDTRGVGRSSKRSASSHDFSSSSRTFMSAPTSPGAQQHTNNNHVDGPAISPPQATRLEHRLEPGLLSPGRPTIRTSRSARSVLQTRRSPVTLIDLSGVQPSTSAISSPTSAHTHGSASTVSPRTAPLSATRSTIRANVERSRSTGLASATSPHNGQLAVVGPSVSRKSSGNSLHLLVSRIEDMEELNEDIAHEEVIAGASVEGSPSNAGTLMGSPVDAGLSPRGIPFDRKPSRELKLAASSSTSLLHAGDGTSSHYQDRSSPTRRRHQSHQASPEERLPVQTPPHFRKNQSAAATAPIPPAPVSPSSVPEGDLEASIGHTDMEIFEEQVRESQRNRKLRKMFGENVKHGDLAMAPQSDNVNWNKLNKKLGMDRSAAERSGSD